MSMIITFPGGLKINAIYKGYTIETDQPKSEDGEGTAPEPFDLFLASIGTCAGAYIVRFLKNRDIPVDGLQMKLDFIRDETGKRIEKIVFDIKAPKNFPDKYLPALKSAINACAVKKHIESPPQFEVKIEKN